MSGDVSAASHLSVAMTTDEGEMTQTTGGTGVTSSSLRGAPLYFACFVVVIGIVGTVANGLVLYALVASKQHRKQELIVNQNALDLYSCIFLVVTYGLKLFNINLTGSLGYWLCMLIKSENLLWCGVYGSMVNLTLIAIERYLKVVHAVWSKNKLRKWMIYSGIAIAWISGIVHQMPVAFESSAVINGACYGFVIWKNPVDGVAYGIFYFLVAYVIVLLIFIFCYGKILMAIRHQASVMAGHSTTGPSTAQTQSNKIQANVIKTMILVCAFYAVAWFPESTYFLLMSLKLNLTFLDAGYYVVLFIAFLYICTNLRRHQKHSECSPKPRRSTSKLCLILAFVRITFIRQNTVTVSLYLRQSVHLRH